MTLLTRLRFVSAFQKLRVNKTDEILFVLFTFVQSKDDHRLTLNKFISLCTMTFRRSWRRPQKLQQLHLRRSAKRQDRMMDQNRSMCASCCRMSPGDEWESGLRSWLGTWGMPDRYQEPAEIMDDPCLPPWTLRSPVVVKQQGQFKNQPQTHIQHLFIEPNSPLTQG